MELFWHRRDPRTVDNAGLAAAARSGTVVPVFVYDADLLGTLGDRQRVFYLRAVKRLEARYRELGSDLVVRSGAPDEALVDLAEEYDAETVFYNEHYRAARRNRQRRVDAALSDDGVGTDRRTDLVLVDPGRLERSYPNHSQFHNDWEAVPKRGPYEEPPADALASVGDGKTVPEPDADIDLPAAGYRAARDRFDGFLDRGITSYNDTRDDLARAVEAPTRAVSRMSPYLATGAIGIRELWSDAGEVYDAVSGGERRNVDKYRYELSWREQQYHLLYYNPDLAVSNYKEFPNEIAWREADEDFEAWKRGETGYPLVDAGMRQLNEEGYIHNRPRQVVASFLTKHLLVDWRKGARYFTEQLIDHDYASNHGGWQWTASTGTDSVDVRIFDPVSQASKYDDGAAFIREYVPELREAPTERIIEWPTLSDGEREAVAPEYPHPIVDRNEGYERAQRVFEEALGKR
ncbi:cryptochrome/photolyase family protein [Natronomonas sp.]|uniref:cryptochrome/photolyase family protein n=1 Tax=Natronomonas sp. TaxID=2184060 RepID=UPI00261C1CFE|nr:deoxyribodipyrimidine photo-lyase [Natronomonas sp.]